MKTISMIPEIWSMTDKNFSHFGPFFALLHPLPPYNNPENQNFEKTKKNPKDIILQKCIIHDNHKIYASWDMKWTRHYFFVILHHFLSFYTPNSPKKNSKNWKNILEISFNTSVPKIMIICFTVPKIWCITDVVIFHVGLFFSLLPPPTHHPTP